ncbi:MAG: hypothetical protein ACRDBG_02610 [Waterburya sp.]
MGAVDPTASLLGLDTSVIGYNVKGYGLEVVLDGVLVESNLIDKLANLFAFINKRDFMLFYFSDRFLPLTLDEQVLYFYNFKTMFSNTVFTLNFEERFQKRELLINPKGNVNEMLIE